MRFTLTPTEATITTSTLLEFIRSKGFNWHQLGCGEGGCGACTVVVGKYDAAGKAPYRYKSVNACLLPLVAVHGCHVLTVEGIGTSANPHPIQERIGKLFGSQCGFCTPGIVMSLYATVRNGYGRLTEEISSIRWMGVSADAPGTGYLDAAKSFATVKSNGSSSSSSNSNSEDSDDARTYYAARGGSYYAHSVCKGRRLLHGQWQVEGLCATATTPGISTTAHTIQRCLTRPSLSRTTQPRNSSSPVPVEGLIRLAGSGLYRGPPEVGRPR